MNEDTNELLRAVGLDLTPENAVERIFALAKEQPLTEVEIEGRKRPLGQLSREQIETWRKICEAKQDGRLPTAEFTEQHFRFYPLTLLLMAGDPAIEETIENGELGEVTPDIVAAAFREVLRQTIVIALSESHKGSA
jgi:hypothetical protein